ncbi:hypothetical protein ATY41_07635 [Leifsonia xyli subsp. xyli]|uniref:DUF3618 domain-containing protein n=2 Tax=Leifsonia xyli subsp. xyli TaxID=59736 RepID=Q6AHF3_LEIXX|nr:DUF3618 domain-containing protein [Leifsonia xyli]AAT88192.1 hypothetical protein Lxx01080 [Leifsonia xyli subsp. xyli str. CTCB07]ODA90927.1 hypothetical protein ATY41_07635 [Leifsonia xyli subsp. xyli]
MTTDRSDAERARAELAATLDAIEYKLNIPKRAAECVRTLRRENPLAFAGIAVGAAIVAATAAWGLVALVRR